MLVAAPVVRPLVNFSAIAGLETIILNVEPAVGVRDFLGAVAVLRQSLEFIRRTGAAILPVLDRTAVPSAQPIVFQVEAAVDVNDAVRAATPACLLGQAPAVGLRLLPRSSC